jgi:hypothetical protein
MVFDRLPERAGHAYLVAAFFVLPATAVVLSGGTRPVGPAVEALLWAIIANHGLFLVASVVD